MRNQLAMVKNVDRLQSAYTGLASRDAGTPGMGLVYGFTGSGKTTSIAWLVNQVRGVYVRAFATWTPSAMLGSIMIELGADPLGSCAKMVSHIVATLARTGRPLFIDEADYLCTNTKMIETLRDIHDASSTPVILIGMEGIERKLVHRQQLARRISRWMEFSPADGEDARTLVSTVCEVAVADDLIDRLHEQAKGSIGLMVVGLSRVEAYAKAQRWSSIDSTQWGNRPFFLPRPVARGAA
jgi:type II secretory pathway predicted ATPase ExeA